MRFLLALLSLPLIEASEADHGNLVIECLFFYNSLNFLIIIDLNVEEGQSD